jgi:hypothetical protein
MLKRHLSATAATLGLLVFTASAGVASAGTTSPASPPAPASGLLTFVPPSVGPLRVNIGPTIIGGKMISQGVNVSTPGVTLPPITWTPPAGLTFPISGAPVH